MSQTKGKSTSDLYIDNQKLEVVLNRISNARENLKIKKQLGFQKTEMDSFDDFFKNYNRYKKLLKDYRSILKKDNQAVEITEKKIIGLDLSANRKIQFTKK